MLLCGTPSDDPTEASAFRFDIGCVMPLVQKAENPSKCTTDSDRIPFVFQRIGLMGERFCSKLQRNTEDFC